MSITTFLRNRFVSLLRQDKDYRPRGEWVTCLQCLAQELEVLTQDSESEFLAMGEFLQDYSNRAQEISEASSSAVQLMSGSELNQAIEKLDIIFRHMADFKNECEQGTDVLKNVLHLLTNVKESVGGFMKIVKTLSILGIFTRVESAHLGDAGADFSTLADEVNLLAQDIEAKSNDIVAQSQSLSSLIQVNLAKVIGIEAQQQGRIQTMMDNTVASLTALTAKHVLSSATAQKISDNFKDISYKISQIITSLQFHDITRQQIEHVEQSLENAGILLEQEPSRDGKGLMPIKMAQRICRIQEAQLATAKDKLTNAVISIVANLTGISSDINAISKDAQELAGDASQEEQTFLGEIKGHLSSAAVSLEQYDLVGHDLALLMDSVAPAIRDMAKFLKEIERIEIAIERIALNSCIKAAHLGQAGVSLGVIAEAIQRLVEETRQHITTLTENLQSIMSASRELSVNQENSAGQANRGVALLIADMEDVLKSLQNLNEDVVSLITRVTEKARILSKDIQKAGQAITVHAQADEVINRGLETLHELKTQFNSQFPSINEFNDAGDVELEKLLAQYTMHDERQIHESVSASYLSQDGEAVPMITYSEDKPDREEKGKDEDDLGDNVELF